MPTPARIPLQFAITRIGESDLIQYGASRTPIDTAEAAYQFWQTIIARQSGFENDKEHLVAILLNTKLFPNGYNVVSVGSLNETIAHPREVFRPAIVTPCYGLLLAHNHPSGDPTPSQADHRMTRTMCEAATLLQIQLFDHVVIGEPFEGRPPYFSFREAGIL